jgi:hypothetical protein
MGIDWNNQALNAAALLTSPHPLERVQGQVLQILRNSNSSTKTGDELFIELSQPLVSELIQEKLSPFIGEALTPIHIALIEHHIASYLETFVSQAPAIQIAQTSLTGLKVIITCQ